MVMIANQKIYGRLNESKEPPTPLPAEPCVGCCTVDGYRKPGARRPARKLGRCLACYGKAVKAGTICPNRRVALRYAPAAEVVVAKRDAISRAKSDAKAAGESIRLIAEAGAEGLRRSQVAGHARVKAETAKQYEFRERHAGKLTYRPVGNVAGVTA